MRRLQVEASLSRLATLPYDSARSPSQTRQQSQSDQVLWDARDAVENTLCDDNLRISRTHFNKISKEVREAMLYQETLWPEASDEEFIARVLRRVV